MEVRVLQKQIESDNMHKIFVRQKIMTLSDIKGILECSPRTVQRRLRYWNAYTSYNKNGRYYTLGFIARFDQDGLWHYKNVSFSRYGNLRETVIQLVNHCEAGLTSKQLGDLTRLMPSSFIFHFQDDARWRREKIGSRYVYFSSDEQVFNRQREKRLEQLQQLQSHRLPTDTEAVIILVEKIKYPHLEIERLAARLQRKGKTIETGSINNLFMHHGLVKKTAHGTG